MIKSAEEFKRLRESSIPEEYNRAANEEASIDTWNEVLKKYPDLSFWVAQNKTVPVEVLHTLVGNENVNVRCMVARKRKIDDTIFEKLKEDEDESVRHALICNAKLSIERKKRIKTSDSEWLEKELKEKVPNNHSE
ncbi:MAG: HEAT repeat domain-containing protein [Bacteroidota bacterium]